MPCINSICATCWHTELRDGNPCPKDQLEDLKHVGKMTFWEIQRA